MNYIINPLILTITAKKPGVCTAVQYMNHMTLPQRGHQ